MGERFETASLRSHTASDSLLTVSSVFQTAVGLAEFEGDKDEEGKITVKEDHIAQVAEMTGEFKQYLDVVLEGDEDKRAERAFLRTSEVPTRK